MTDLHSEKHLRVKLDRPFHLDNIDPSSTPGLNVSDKSSVKGSLKPMHLQLEDLQGRLWAEHSRSFLLVLQALDAGGKDGTIRRVFKGVNPQGVKVTGFRTPTAQEASHDFLWRIHKALPAKGEIGIFNRSHYEDVVAAYVLGIIDDKERQQRFGMIHEFEDYLEDTGTELVKVFLHISKEEQRERLQDRVDDPNKHWKFSKADLQTRKHWGKYQTAYSEALSATSTEESPWFVIPANHKWYRDYSILKLLTERLTVMDPQYPKVPGVKGTVVK